MLDDDRWLTELRGAQAWSSPSIREQLASEGVRIVCPRCGTRWNGRSVVALARAGGRWEHECKPKPRGIEIY